MSRHKGNVFSNKFHLLNSQENSDEINWSSSSSDYEDSVCERTCNKIQNRKRKRKKKVLKNISNLNITMADASKDSKADVVEGGSPILCTNRLRSVSPILAPTNRPTVNPRVPTSPILHAKTLQRSPIITLKYTSPKPTVTVKKKLFKMEPRQIESQPLQSQQKSFISHTIKDKCSSDVRNIKPIPSGNKIVINETASEESTEILNDNSLSDPKLLIIKNVKNFFDNTFNSSSSQHISETPTPEESSKSDEINILTCKSQHPTNYAQTIHEPTISSDNSNYHEKPRKIKYKKGGMAHRLNLLLKKHTANISLWQHERFLAANSNFVIPKETYSLFYVNDIVLKYGCYEIKAFDTNDESVLILMNNCYMNNNIIKDSVLKIYKPFKVIDFNEDFKLLINVCKFECIDIKK